MSLVRYGRYCLRDVESMSELLPPKCHVVRSRRGATEAKEIRKEWYSFWNQPEETVLINADEAVCELPSLVVKPRVLERVRNFFIRAFGRTNK